MSDLNRRSFLSVLGLSAVYGAGAGGVSYALDTTLYDDERAAELRKAFPEGPKESIANVAADDKRSKAVTIGTATTVGMTIAQTLKL